MKSFPKLKLSPPILASSIMSSSLPLRSYATPFVMSNRSQSLQRVSNGSSCLGIISSAPSLPWQDGRYKWTTAAAGGGNDVMSQDETPRKLDLALYDRQNRTQRLCSFLGCASPRYSQRPRGCLSAIGMAGAQCADPPDLCSRILTTMIHLLCDAIFVLVEYG